MSKIRIEREHGHALESARALARKVAEELAAEYRLRHRWSGDEVTFKGIGVHGKLLVSDTSVLILLTLSGPLKLARPRLEQSIERRLDALLS